MINLHNKNICIVSTAYESEIYYLSKFFNKKLAKNNHITWIAKSSDSSVDNRITQLEEDEFFMFFVKNNFDAIISFGADINSDWAKEFSKIIIDVPTIKSIDDNDVFCYNYIKETLCISDYIYDLLKSNHNSKKIKIPCNANISCSKTTKFYHHAAFEKDESNRNTEDLIDAFLNKNQKLLISGYIDEYNISRLTNNIEYIGVQPKAKINELMCKSEWLLSPSGYEDFGIHIYDAKSYGCKILSSSISSISDLGDHIIDINKNIKKQIENFIKIY